MTRRILALYDSANAEQVGTLDKLRATGNRGDAGGAYRDMALLHGIWLCPVDVPEDFPSEAMDRGFFAATMNALVEEVAEDENLWPCGCAALYDAMLVFPDTYRVVSL